MNPTTSHNSGWFGPRSHVWGHYRLPDGRLVTMRRLGQRVRFFNDATGAQVGPEQSNVYPAVCAAAAAGWYDLDSPNWLNQAMWRETAHNTPCNPPTPR